MFNWPYPYFNEYLNYYRSIYNITVNTKNHSLTLYKNNKIFKTYPVAVGKPTTPTPKGNWVITKKGLWGAQFGGHFMQLSIPTGTYGIHGTNKPWTVGHSISSGCIRMFSNDAKEVYDLVPVGTAVTIY